jgi:energy-coupling factor transport system substrate-specific component
LLDGPSANPELWRGPANPPTRHLPTRLKPAKIVLIPTLVGLNLVMGWIVVATKLPIFLDSIGITVAAILAGPWVAIIVAAATCLLGTVMFSPVLWAFTGTASLIGVLSYLFATRGFYRRWYLAILAGFLIGIAAAAVSAPVAAYVFGGATATGIDAITLAFHSAGKSILEATFLSGFTSEQLDKPLASFIAYVLVHRLSRRMLAWFPGADRRIWGDTSR